MTVEDKLRVCLESVRRQTSFVPKLGIVLGSGLGEFAEHIQVVDRIPYKDIEGFPISTVSGHKGQFVFGYEGEVPLVIMQGRVHYYEGYEMSDVVLPIRLMRLLGAKTLLLTNAAGGVNKTFCPGDLMAITDQVAFQVPNPLRGANVDTLGERFPDMSEIYSKRLMALLIQEGDKLHLSLKKGVYAQLSGPSYETPAEIRFLEKGGVDAVGMSTACEAIAANHMGMQILGISCITNMAAGVSTSPLSHEEVKETADKVAGDFQSLVKKVVQAMQEEGLLD